MFQYRQVLVRLRQGDSDRDIARSRLMGRKKLGKLRALAEQIGWLDPAQPLPDDATLASALTPARVAASTVSTLTPFAALIRQWCAQGIQGTTMHAVLCRNHGYTGSYSAVRRFLQQLAASEPEVCTTMRLDFDPAEAAQVDFGAGPTITDVHTGEVFKTWVFVMTLCWSRHQYAEVVRDQSIATWLGCHRRAFEWFGGVPSRIIIDNPKCAITRACITDPTVQRAYAECAEGYGFKISPCPPRDPQKKGIVESGVKYVKRNFVPLRDFRDLADANRQLQEWVLSTAGTRNHGTTREQPLARFTTTESILLIALPAHPPEIATWAKVTVHRDAHVQFEKTLYSVPFRLMGQQLWLRATDQLIQIYREQERVATHVRTSSHRRSTVHDHLPPDALAWAMADPQHCLRESERIGPQCHALIMRLFADRVLDHLRAAQGVIRLEKQHGAARLEAACGRALAFNDPRYRTVKAILAKGLDQASVSDSFDSLANTYTRGGRFSRRPSTVH